MPADCCRAFHVYFYSWLGTRNNNESNVNYPTANHFEIKTNSRFHQPSPIVRRIQNLLDHVKIKNTFTNEVFVYRLGLKMISLHQRCLYLEEHRSRRKIMKMTDADLRDVQLLSEFSPPLRRRYGMRVFRYRMEAATFITTDNLVCIGFVESGSYQRIAGHLSIASTASVCRLVRRFYRNSEATLLQNTIFSRYG